MKRNKRPLQPLQPGAHIYGYARDSGGQAQELSIAQQRERIEAWATEQQYVIVGWFTDDAKPGSSAENREGFLAMIDACCAQQHPVDAVAAWDFSRFSRDETDRAYYHALLTKQGVHFVSISQPLPEGLASGIMREVIAYSDAEYLRTLSRNVKRGLTYVTTLGRNHGRNAPPGYKSVVVSVGTRRDGTPRNVQRWEVDEETAPKVREAFAMYTAGYAVRDIHEKLHLCNNYASYGHLFANPIFVGQVKVGEVERYDESLRLIDDETWQKAQARRSKPQPPRVAASQAMLSGLLKCGLCGSSMVYQSFKRRYGAGSYCYYACARQRSIHKDCNNRIRSELIDRAAMDHVMDALTIPEHLDLLARQYQERIANNPVRAQAQELDARIVKTEQAIERLLDLAEAGTTPPAEVRRRLQQREQELAELRAKRHNLPPESAKEPMSAEMARELLEGIRTELVTEDVRAKRRLLTLLITKVVFTPPDDLNVVWRETPGMYV